MKIQNPLSCCCPRMDCEPLVTSDSVLELQIFMLFEPQACDQLPYGFIPQWLEHDISNAKSRGSIPVEAQICVLTIVLQISSSRPPVLC